MFSGSSTVELLMFSNTIPAQTYELLELSTFIPIQIQANHRRDRERVEKEREGRGDITYICVYLLMWYIDNFTKVALVPLFLLLGPEQ